MALNKTSISWTNISWNPVHGCSKISPGCLNCYAERISHQYKVTTKPWNEENADENIQLKPHRLDEPYRIKEPSMIFVNSMSDLFHKKVPYSYIDEVFKVMNDCKRHTFQILTKRPRRAAKYPGLWSKNIWQGTSIESPKYLYRIDQLRECPAKLLFLSIEPLIERLGTLNLEGIGWVIVGGESGPRFRPMEHSWAREIRDQCLESNVPFFFKQSASHKNEKGTQLIEENGSKTTWQQFPNMPPPILPENEQLSLF